MAWWGELFSELTWLAKSHQQMYDDIHGGPGYGGGQGTVEHYDKTDRALQAIQQRIEKGVKELSANWSGGAADQATALTRASANWAGAAGVATINARGQSLHQASAFVDARNKMPEPRSVPDIMSGKGFPAANLIVDIVRAKEQADAAHQEAARIMKNYEISTSQHIGAMPQYPAVQTMVTSTVVAPPPQPPPPGGSSGGETSGTRQPGADGGSSGPGTPGSPGGPGAGPQPPGPGSGPGPAPGPDGPGAATPGGQSKPGTGTSGNAFQPPPPPPVGQGPVPGGDVARPGSPITTGVPVGFGPFGGNNPAAPGTGQGLPGTGRGGPGDGSGRGGPGEGGRGGVTRGPGGVAGGAEPAAARGAAGPRGGAGAPGMMPGAGRSNREEDQEHQRKYVVLDDAHLEDDNPPTAPPVIGETKY